MPLTLPNPKQPFTAPSPYPSELPQVLPSGSPENNHILLPYLSPTCFLSLSGVAMLSQGDVYVVNSGQTIDLHCEFYMEYFDLFDNPVIWKKTQRTEDSQINIMGNIVPPFLETDRFVVDFAQSHPRFDLKLTIKSKLE